MNISGPYLSKSFEAFADPVNGPRGRVMTAASVSDARPPRVIESGPGAQEASATGDVQTLVSKANDLVKSMNVGIEFSVDPESRNKIIRVVDAETRSILRQFPSEEMLTLSRAIEKMQAALVKQTA